MRGLSLLRLVLLYSARFRGVKSRVLRAPRAYRASPRRICSHCGALPHRLLHKPARVVFYYLSHRGRKGRDSPPNECRYPMSHKAQLEPCGKTIVDGSLHAGGLRCEMTALRVLLSHTGIELSEPLLFGLGSGPCPSSTGTRSSRRSPSWAAGSSPSSSPRI